MNENEHRHTLASYFLAHDPKHDGLPEHMHLLPGFDADERDYTVAINWYTPDEVSSSSDAVITVRRTILEEAGELVYGDREDDYGHPKFNFQTIADLFNAYIDGKLRTCPDDQLGEPLLTPEDVASMMILVKMSRMVSGRYKRDTVVDIAGYAAVIERLMEEGDA